MAGLASAAYIAFLTNRTLRADFPALQHCFAIFGPPIRPGQELQYGPVGLPFHAPTHIIPINGSRDSGVISALGEFVSKSLLPHLTPYQTVYYHSNRGVSRSLLPEVGQDAQWHIHQCILRTLFMVPRPSFLNHTVELLSEKSMKLKEILSELQSNTTTSIGIHVRFSDEVTRNSETQLLGRHTETVDRIAKCISNISHHSSPVVYLSTNSDTLGEVLLTKFNHSSTRVMVQKPGAIRHINFREWPEKFRNSSSPNFHQRMNSAVVRTVVDLFLLSQTRMLIIDRESGFSMGAAVISHTDPIIYHLDACRVTKPKCSLRFTDS